MTLIIHSFTLPIFPPEKMKAVVEKKGDDQMKPTYDGGPFTLKVEVRLT